MADTSAIALRLEWHDGTRSYLDILCAHGAHTCDPKDKAYRIENVRFPTTVQTGDRVEALVPATDDGPDSVGLEPINHDLNDPHVEIGQRRQDPEVAIGQEVQRALFTCQY